MFLHLPLDVPKHSDQHFQCAHCECFDKNFWWELGIRNVSTSQFPENAPLAEASLFHGITKIMAELTVSNPFPQIKKTVLCVFCVYYCLQICPFLLVICWPKGRHQWKTNVFFRALPELPNPPPLTSIRVTWSFFRTSKFKIWKSV